VEQLSNHELATILRIERRFYEAQKSSFVTEPGKRERHYLAPIQVRHPRVLLLDGERGTGKTSMLLTLVKRWSLKKNDFGLPHFDAEAYIRMIEGKIAELKTDAEIEFRSGDHDNEIPSHVSVVGRILDFDSLPLGMSVIAGIVEAWRPLAEEYDRLSGYTDDCEEGETLLDRWHKLFHVAAVGWSAVPSTSGLIEQVLDREEQVREWHNFDSKWQSFVNQVIARGKCLDSPHRLEDKPVFVIMIDDCDLQVGRVRELLPALRMLYHPNVFFLVAAHRPHLIDMLELDFLGQQNRLANCQLRENALSAADSDRWAANLAKSSFEKVFPIRNRWSLRQLSVRNLLKFPHGEDDSFGTIFESWDQRPLIDTPRLGTLDVYLREITGTDAEPTDLPVRWTYRTAHQIFERVSSERVKAEEFSSSRDGAAEALASSRQHTGARQNRAAEALGRILGGADYEEIIRITGWVNIGSKGSKAPNIGPEDEKPIIEYLDAGRLTSFAPGEFFEDISDEAAIVLSSQAGFRYTHDLSADLSTTPADLVARRTSAVIAKSLQDDAYGVVAPRLRWEIGLSLVWTRTNLSTTDLAFRWRLYQHPSPLRLLYLNREWRKFVVSLSQQTEERLDHIAYGWIYHQLRWMSKDGLYRNLADLPAPLSVSSYDDAAWEQLLSIPPEIGSLEDRENWRTLTLPLLARPEIGLSQRVQGKLLALVKDNRKAVVRLRDQRRRLITDAILAAADEKGATVPIAESEGKVDDLIKEIEGRYLRTYKGRRSQWASIVEKLPRPTKGRVESQPNLGPK
jgi:hypothetical protein